MAVFPSLSVGFLARGFKAGSFQAAGLRLLWAWCLLCLFLSQAQAEQYQSHQLKGQVLWIELQQGRVSLTPQHAGAVAVHYQREGETQISSFAHVGEPEQVQVTLKVSQQSLLFDLGQLQVEVQKQPFKLRYYRQGRLLLAEESGMFVQNTLRGFRFALQEQEKIMGTGQRVLGMDRRGHRLPLYNKAHYGYGGESKQMYYSLPAVMSSNRYILVFDNSAKGAVDIGASEPDVLQFEAVAGRTAYWVVAGESYPELIHNYVKVSGKQPMPPRWALGNIASRFGYHTEAETRAVVAAYQQKDFPLDAVVLDLYWFGPDIKGHMGKLQWDRSAFPQPEQMMQDFLAQGVRTVVITEPFILSNTDNFQNASEHQALAMNVAKTAPKRFDFYFGNTGLIDVFDDNASDWFMQTYRRLHQQGVSGWWGDLGEPEVHPGDSLHRWQNQWYSADEIHNAYGHQWAKRVYQLSRELTPEKRPFIMMRSGFVGSQRYGMIPWTGDVSRSWDGLKPQIELSLQMGLLGLGYTHSDLGGFAGGKKFDKELYIRWLQYGVFQPVYRPHAQEHIAPEPVFHDKETQDILRRYIKLRYRLLPYNYHLAWENSQTGMPLMRPVFFQDPDNLDLILEDQQYYWGDAFLVQPVTEPGLSQMTVTLPKGVWFDFWQDQRVEGNKTFDYPLDLETLPVWVKAGAFVPMTEDIANTDAYDPSQLILHYYADSSVTEAKGSLYNDDGETFNAYQKQQYEQLQFRASHTDQLKINLTREGFSYRSAPTQRQPKLVVHNWQTPPKKVTCGGDKLKVRSATDLNKRQQAGYHYNSNNQQLSVRCQWQKPSLDIHIH